MNATERRAIEILLVEDNPGDVHLTLDALRNAPTENRVHVVGNGEEAVTYLRDALDSGTHPPPDLMLLDLNLPRMTGHDVLSSVRADARTRTLPIVVFTSSEREVDVFEAYGRRANCFVTKPTSADDFEHLVHCISTYWSRVSAIAG